MKTNINNLLLFLAIKKIVHIVNLLYNKFTQSRRLVVLFMNIHIIFIILDRFKSGL